LLAAKITVQMGRDPGEIYRELARKFGEPVCDHVEASATLEQNRMLAQLSQQQLTSAKLAGEKNTEHPYPGSRQRCTHWRLESRDGERLVRRTAVRHKRHLQNLCKELSRSGASVPNHDEAQSIVHDALAV
jgi:phosphoglucomutase